MRLNIPKWVMIIGAAEGAGFDVDNIGEQVIGVVQGTTDAKAIPGQVIAEGVDVARNFKEDPLGTGMNVAVGVAVPYVMFKGLGSILHGFGVPTSIGGVQYAIPPRKHRRARKKVRRAIRRIKGKARKKSPRRR